MRVDFHSHILPQMDDGAASIDESIALLKMLADSEVKKVVLTPHFYRQNEDIAHFLERRTKSYAKLCDAVKNIDGLPELVLGAEVYFYPSLSSDPDFEKLSIEGTEYILLELPFERFYDNFFSSFTSFTNRCDKKIILAHAERYLEFGNTKKDIERLMHNGNITCQMNCTSIAQAGFFKMKTYSAMISEGMVSVIGTDTHNTSTRLPMYGKAENVIRKKCGNCAFDRICENSEKIFTAH